MSHEFELIIKFKSSMKNVSNTTEQVNTINHSIDLAEEVIDSGK